MPTPDSFYVVARECGAENPSIPTWANRKPNPLALAECPPIAPDNLVDVAVVPGAFQLLNVLSPAECQRLVELTESLGFLEDAAVSLPRHIRHNDNVVWVTDEATDELIWRRVAPLVNLKGADYEGKRAVGINARFRFYRYGRGDYFHFHTDGSWPGSRVIEGELVANAYDDRYSQMTFLIFLNDDFKGGATRFLVNANDSSRPARRSEDSRPIDVRTPQGGVLCFPHGMHPWHCIHSSEPITAGTKYIIRTDVLFEL